MQLTIATITARDEPHYEWLIDELAAQAESDDEIEVVVIDFHAREPSELMPGAACVPSIRRVMVHPPKPTPWQGAHRVTSRDLHAIANARNTALCLATFGYIAFLDDRVHIGKKWLDTVRRAEHERASAICGPCDRMVGMDIEIDSRSAISPRGEVGCDGAWLYGGNFALPLAWALEVNGCEEGTDPTGGQDCVMGLMLANHGHRIDFDMAMGVVIDRRLETKHPFQRIDEDGPRGRTIVERFAGLLRTEMTPNLDELRTRIMLGERFPPHDRLATDLDWFSGEPIGKM